MPPAAAYGRRRCRVDLPAAGQSMGAPLSGRHRRARAEAEASRRGWTDDWQMASRAEQTGIPRRHDRSECCPAGPRADTAIDFEGDFPRALWRPPLLLRHPFWYLAPHSFSGAGSGRHPLTSRRPERTSEARSGRRRPAARRGVRAGPWRPPCWPVCGRGHPVCVTPAAGQFAGPAAARAAAIEGVAAAC